MRWFGESWNAPVNDETAQAQTPVGLPCLRCGQPIHGDDRGVLLPDWSEPTESAFHLRCFLLVVLHDEDLIATLLAELATEKREPPPLR